MKKWIIPVSVILAVVLGIFSFRANRYTPIDEWSSQLTQEKVEWAEVACGYGEEKISYDIPAEEYEMLLQVLKTISEDNSARKVPEGTERTDYRLALHYDGKLWLFSCKTGGFVGLTFEDAETGAVYGCEGKILYIDSPDLSRYICGLIDEKAS